MSEDLFTRERVSREFCRGSCCCAICLSMVISLLDGGEISSRAEGAGAGDMGLRQGGAVDLFILL